MVDKLELEYEVNEYGDVILSLDLTPYIEAFANKRLDPERYSNLKDNLFTMVSRANINNCWNNILRFSSEGFSESSIDAIEKSPAVEIMEEHFAEILMNAIDETIQANHANKRNSPCLNMTIRIDAESEPDIVSIDIFDNGRGYPPKFLEKMATEDGRINYMLAAQNTADLKKQDAHAQISRTYDGPDLVGGRGLGLRLFIADAQNDQLVGLGTNKKLKNVYPKSEDYSLSFENLQDQSPDYRGGIISLRTPLSPRKSFADLTVDLRSKRRHIETPSPDITTNESVTSKSSLSVDVRASSSLSLDLDFDDEDSEEDNNQGFSPR